MVREPDATMQPTPQDNQLMSKHRVLSLKPQLRVEWRGQDGQNETEQTDHSASLGDSITASTRIRFSVHTRSADRDARRTGLGDGTGRPQCRGTAGGARLQQFGSMMRRSSAHSDNTTHQAVAFCSRRLPQGFCRVIYKGGNLIMAPVSLRGI